MVLGSEKNPGMGQNKTKRTWEYDADIIDSFDQWAGKTGMMKNAAAQLALWVLMHLDATQRQDYMDQMNARSLSATDDDKMPEKRL